MIFFFELIKKKKKKKDRSHINLLRANVRSIPFVDAIQLVQGELIDGGVELHFSFTQKAKRKNNRIQK